MQRAMHRILIAECKQEVSTFNPHLSQYGDFKIRRGQELLSYHRTVRNEIGGALSVFDECAVVETVPAYSACFITSGGTLADQAWQRIAREFLESIEAVPAVDAVYLCMHGAMASESELDPEGFLIAETRRIVGDRVRLLFRSIFMASLLIVWWSIPMQSLPTTLIRTSTFMKRDNAPHACC